MAVRISTSDLVKWSLPQKDLQHTSWERNSAVVGKRLNNRFGDYDGNKTEIKEG